MAKINPDKSVLKISGFDKAIDCPGSVLEAQMELQNGWYLILTTEDSPYDEALHATLLDQRFEVLDQVEVSQDMTPGIIKDLKSIGDWALQFSFNRDKPYVLEINPAGYIVPLGRGYAKRPLGKVLGKKYWRII